MQFFNQDIITEIPLAVLIIGVVLVGLWLANIIYDAGVPQYISRKIGHAAGGVAFLICLMFSAPGWPVILAAWFGTLFVLSRILRPNTFRGVGGSGRKSGVMAEVWFAWAAVPVFLIAWSWLDRPEIAVASLLFMAWGDGVTGLVRSQVYRNGPTKGWWGSLAMLDVSLAISLAFVRPFWIGIVASVAAVMVERFFGDNGTVKWADDNLAIPLVSMGVMLGLMALTGNL